MTHWIDDFADDVLADLVRRRTELRLCELIRKERWSREDFSAAASEILLATKRHKHDEPQAVGPEIIQIHPEPELDPVSGVEEVEPMDPALDEPADKASNGIFRDHFEAWIYLEPKSRYNMILSTWSNAHGGIWTAVRDAGGIEEAAKAAGVELGRHLPHAILPSFSTPECPAPTYRDALASYAAILGASNVRGSWHECVRQINEGSHGVA